MKQVILDTSFIITCIKQKIDFFHEISMLGLQSLIPKQVIEELEKISKSRNKNKTEAIIALQTIKEQNNPMRIKPKIIEIPGNITDKAIINYANKNTSIVVATLDKEIKLRVLGNKLIIRNRNQLELI